MGILRVDGVVASCRRSRIERVWYLLVEQGLADELGRAGNRLGVAGVGHCDRSRSLPVRLRKQLEVQVGLPFAINSRKDRERMNWISR